MHIQYFGLSSFKITTKEATIISDPFNKESGLTSPKGKAEIVTLAEKNNDLYNVISGISGDPFLISDPGEYDLKGVTVTGIPLKQDDNRYVSVYLIESEDIAVLNLTHIREWNIEERQLEELGQIDILILPVGSNSVLTPKEAAKIVHEIEPKFVIPSHYQIDGLKLPYEPLEVFLKQIGGKAETTEKLTIKKKDLEDDKTKVIVLDSIR
ncbi:MAG: MBL fold metallo-hydrolase [Candidatus Doudnabacteria bacterium]